ncbi:MAG: hypothetical protein EOP39_03990 [Rubrivivax sp.]|nr:MAG: hypothetical protein EOP39_03990 [Rubrivivax sp.]
MNSAPRIGSEGYGPYIERAYAGTDAAAAWEAVQWLRHCTTNEIRRQSFEQARDRGVAPEMMTQMMVEADADARRCQTVTAQHHALLPELAARAGRAGLPEVRHAYVNSLFARELSAAQRQDVAQRMRRDARAGLGPSLLNAALSDAGWGLSDEEKFAFLLAYATQFDQPGSLELLRLLREHGYLQPRGSLTRQQMAVARELGLRALEQVPARSR